MGSNQVSTRPIKTMIFTLSALMAIENLALASPDRSAKREAKESYSATEGQVSQTADLSSDDSEDLDSISTPKAAPKKAAARKASRSASEELHAAPSMEPSKATKQTVDLSDGLDDIEASASAGKAKAESATAAAPVVDELDQLETIHAAPKMELDTAPSKAQAKAAEDPRLKERIDSLEKEVSAMRAQNEPKPARSAPKNAVADLVPDDQRAPLIKRLRLVETLIREHGLAYDYKTLTTQQLENLVAQLHSKD